MRCQSIDQKTKPLSSSVIACKLLQACIESAKQMLNILVVVQKQSLLGEIHPQPFQIVSIVLTHIY